MKGLIRIFFVLFTITLSVVAYGQTRDRSLVAEDATWNLVDLYPSEEAWQQAKNKQVLRIDELADFAGRLSESAKTLEACLDLRFDIAKELNRLYLYADMHADLDTRVSKYQGMGQEVQQIFSKFSSASAFMEPEILGMNEQKVEKFIDHNDNLDEYAFYLRDIMRRKAHTGTEAEEKIIAEAGLMAGNAGDVYSIFSNADFPYPRITLSTGEEVELNAANFTLYRASEVLEDRAEVFRSFFNALGAYKSTFGSQLYGEVKKNIFYKNVRNYESCLARALDNNNIPVDVYKSLIENVNRNLDTFHRYLALRKKILGVGQLHYYDMYAPLLEGTDIDFTVDESEQIILSALKPLGEDYVGTVKEAFGSRWIDMYPTPGKRSGAYSNGAAYDVHPYILMNYNGKYEDVSTLAHELGHTMHSFLSNTNQPYPKARYSIFAAEVASTFNEALLSDYMLKNYDDPKIQLSILGSWLDGVKGTLFRQTQFAEFELKIHELAEKGEALTGEKFDEIYLEMVRKYYGHDKGICIVDDYVKAEWSYIPHFYYNFYVYQYATSFTASQAFSEQILAGDQEMKRKYLEFLSAGGSRYPIDLLKDTGVDMTTAQPFDLTITKMNKVMDEIEKILVDLNL